MSGLFVTEARREGKPFLFAVAVIAALGGFLFGYDTGVISGALLYIAPELHASSFEQEAIVGALLLGAVGGAVMSGYLADAISRKWTKVISGTVYALAALACAFSQSAGELIAARFILGLSVGTASFVSPMYIAELSPKRIRGGLVSFNQLMIVTGILFAYIADFGLKGVGDNWRWMLGLGAVPGLALAIGMLAMPHSPRWLAERGREEEAREALERTHRAEDVDEEMTSIKDVASREGRLRDLLATPVRSMLVVGLALAIFQQIVGINTIIYYAPTILSFSGNSASSAIGQTVFIGVTNLVFTIVAILLLDRLGRRFFLLAGTIGLAIALAVLGAFFLSSTLQDSVSYLSLVALIVYIACFAIGLGPVFWLMISEIFPLELRGPAMAVCTVANWSFNFLISFTFLTLVDAIGKTATFWLYGVVAVIAVVFFALKVPETMGRSLEQIQEDVTGRKRRRRRTAPRTRHA
ncbi:MAG TPA: sugar porter family MFS transporter [Gaiellales bacterium]|nr:sugar porter family MFS transporter [Gaiellales bacterium]